MEPRIPTTFSMVTGVFWLVVILLFPSIADACPNCKDGLHQNYQSMAFAISIAMMLMMPLFLLGIWSLVFFKLRPVDEADSPEFSAQRVPCAHGTSG